MTVCSGVLWAVRSIPKLLESIGRIWLSRSGIRPAILLSLGVDLKSITDVNNYIKFKILEYEYFKLMNNDLWEQYKEDFADFTEAIFKACNLTAICNLRTLLRH